MGGVSHPPTICPSRQQAIALSVIIRLDRKLRRCGRPLSVILEDLVARRQLSFATPPPLKCPSAHHKAGVSKWEEFCCIKY